MNILMRYFVRAQNVRNRKLKQKVATLKERLEKLERKAKRLESRLRDIESPPYVPLWPC